MGLGLSPTRLQLEWPPVARRQLVGEISVGMGAEGTVGYAMRGGLTWATLAQEKKSRSVSIDSIRYIGNLSVRRVGIGGSDAHKEWTLGLASSTLWPYSTSAPPMLR